MDATTQKFHKFRGNLFTFSYSLFSALFIYIISAIALTKVADRTGLCIESNIFLLELFF